MFRNFICGNDSKIYFDNFFNSLEEGILLGRVIYDSNGEIMDFSMLECNKAFERIFETGRESFIGKTINDFYPIIAQKWLDICKQASESGSNTKSDIHFEIADKHFKVNVICPIDGQIILFFNDITAQIKADEILKKHFILFENAHDILLYLKSDGTIIDANKTAIDNYGYSYMELLSMNIQQLRHPSMVVHYNEQMALSASRGIVFEGIHVRKDGTTFPVEVSSRSIKVNEELLRIHIIRDITDRKEAEDKIKYLANYDALTSIPNRGFLMQQFEEILGLAANKTQKFAVMLFDVDKFKSINDVYGHNAGDEVLKKVGQRLKAAVGASDIVGRLGGDEFLVIQPRIETSEEASALACRILNSVCRPVRFGDNEINIRISIGIALYPEASQNPKGLIHCADTAMYAIKQNGGNSYNIYSD